MRIELGVGAGIAVLVMLSGVIAAEQQRCESPLPANVDVPRELERTVTRIFRRSATFRAQCERIAGALNLKVTVRISTAIPTYCRAFSVVERHGQQIRASVHLPPSTDHSELLAHEFEHLLEQLEGINLRVLARVKGSGVREIEWELFETDRAQAAGRVVAIEARGHARAGD